MYKFYYGCNLPYNNIIINPNNIPECHFDDDDSIEEKMLLNKAKTRLFVSAIKWSLS